jgi:hypothetical protein
VGKLQLRLTAVLGLIALAGSPEAFAKDAAEPPKSLFVQVYASDDLSETERVAIEQAVSVGLRGDATGDIKSAKAGPSQAERQAIAEGLARGDKALAAAKKRIKELDAEGAISLLESASDEYVRFLPELVVRDFHAHRLLDTHIQMAIAQFLEGEEAAADRALTQALVLDPSLEYSTKQFPPQLDELVISARLAIDELGRGAIRIEGEIAGAEVTVFVNGDDKGHAPLTVSDLAPGPNTVHLRAPGMESKVIVVDVEGGGIATVAGSLVARKSVVVGPLAGTRGVVGAAKADDKLVEAAKSLGTEGLVLVVSTKSQERLQLTAYLYDMRRRRLVSRTVREVPRDQLTEASLVGRAVYGQVQWDALDAADDDSPKLWEHKYFWPAVGTAAGVIVLGVVVGIVANDGLSPAKKAVLFPITTRF